ncbi:MAG: ABC transporter permease subunit [Clostridia bacterium]|nr:ABC transporter permease subunit [Clostridia bacterium]
MGFLKEISKNKYLYILAIPGVLFQAIFSYIPMFGHLLAFKKYRLSLGILKSPWCGFDNFKFFFGTEDWYKVTFNTIFLNFLFITFTMIFAILVAIFLNEIKNTIIKKFIQSIIFFPYFVSWLVVSLMAFSMLNETDGFVNNIMVSIGYPKINFYSRPELWPPLLTLIYVWVFAGYYSIIFIAAILGIPQDCYESAKIDGASKLQQILKITLPLIRPTVIILVLLSIGRIFYSDFGMIYGIIGDNGVLFPTTDVIDTYSFRALRQMGNFGMAAAVVLYQSIMGLITICIFNLIVKKIDPNSSLF